MSDPLPNVDDILALTPMQRLMLMHSLRVSGASTLVNQFIFRLRGALNRARFHAAWQRACDRHPALRTAFVHEELEQPVQVVRSQLTLSMPFVDLGGLEPDDRKQRVEELLREDRSRGFDLLKAPLMRMTLVRLDPREHLLVWTRHHLILDLWSVETLFEEVFTDYEQPDFEPPPVTGYGEYVAWLARQDPAAVERHWRERMTGLRAPSLVFTDRPRRSEWSGAGQPVARARLDCGTWQRLQVMAQEHGLTLAVLLQGALALVIASRLDREDVAFGLTVSGRPPDLPGVERILGSFINNVPVRTRIDPAQRLVDWLRRIQHGGAERLPYEHASLTEIHRWSDIPVQSPLFDVLLLLQSPVARPPGTGTISIEPIEGPFDSALPFTLCLEPGAERADLTAVYDPVAVDARAAGAFLEAIVSRLEDLPRHASGPVAALLPVAWTGLAPVAEVHGGSGPGRGRASGREDRFPRGDMPAVLLDIWRTTLGVDDIGIDDDFFALGGTSIQAAMAFAEIERCTGRSLPLSTLFEAGSVRALVAALDLPSPAPSPLVAIQRFGPRPPLLAVSGIGGNVVGLAGIARALGESQPFYGLQSTAFADGTRPASDVESIAADFVSASGTLTSGEFALLGVCFGATVVLEMAHQLVAAGRPPALLVILDPVLDDPGAEVGPPSGTRSAALLELVRERARGYATELRGLDGAGRRAFLLGKGGALLRKLCHGGLLHGNEVELRQRQVRAANLQAARRYTPRTYAGETRVLLTAERDIEPAGDPRVRSIRELAPNVRTVQVPGRDTGDALGRHAPVLADVVRTWMEERAAVADGTRRGHGRSRDASRG